MATPAIESSKITGTTAINTYATIKRLRNGHITCVRNQGINRTMR